MNLETYFSIVGVILSVGISFGVVKQQLKQFEMRIQDLESDNKTNRELLIEIKTKIDLLLDGSIKKGAKK